MEDKKTSYKKLLSITLAKFLSYFILIGFIFIFIIFMIKLRLPDSINLGLSICLSLISGILIFYLLHFICRSTTIESFKHDKLDVENTNQFLKKMNLFFTICIAILVFLGIGYLILDKVIFSTAIEKAYSQYSFISPEFATLVATNISEEYSQTLLPKIFRTIIISLSFSISFLSLISYQEKMVKKYNI